MLLKIFFFSIEFAFNIHIRITYVNEKNNNVFINIGRVISDLCIIILHNSII